MLLRMMKKLLHTFSLFAFLSASLVLTGCSVFSGENVDSTSYPISDREERIKARNNHGRLTGDGLTIFGGKDDEAGSGGVGAGIGINSYLWRATLDTLSFMPLAQADPFGGVIITDWYQNPEAPSEQFKLNVLILDQRLRTNALKVSVFRRIKEGDQWVDAPASETVARELEDKILTRARELRIADGR